MLLLGGAATVETLTNMDYRLVSFLIPWGVILYNAAGGLKATFIASYIHTVIIFAVLITMIYDYLDATVSFTEAECAAIYSDSSGVSFYDASKYACGPVDGNIEGSYLTMRSSGTKPSSTIHLTTPIWD